MPGREDDVVAPGEVAAPMGVSAAMTRLPMSYCRRSRRVRCRARAAGWWRWVWGGPVVASDEEEGDERGGEDGDEGADGDAGDDGRGGVVGGGGGLRVGAAPLVVSRVVEVVASREWV